MRSSWEETVATSNYHFDNKINDSHLIEHLGTLPNTWEGDVERIIHNSKPATWATRGYKGEGIPNPSEDLKAEEYDIERIGADPDMVITNMNWIIPGSLHNITKQFALNDCMERIHVQYPGQVWNRHMDKLQKWNPEDPSSVLRVFIQLTAWQPGQFWEIGNYQYSGWEAGAVFTFDTNNIPHCTANAGHHPRVTFQITGIKTEQTIAFLESLR